MASLERAIREKTGHEGARDKQISPNHVSKKKKETERQNILNVNI